jgi:flagellar hook-associated protein 1 FlgK
MRPTFMGLNIASNALLAHQQSLDVIGHNIANASVAGYSRQRLHLAAAPDGTGVGGYGYPGSIGQGVQADALERIRDQFIDRQYRAKTQEQQYYQTQSTYAQRMEASLGELGESGLGLALDKFFNGLQQLSLRPEDLSLRSTVVASAVDLTYALRTFTEDVTQLQADTDRDLAQSVQDINRLTAGIAHLNGEIAKRVNLGETPSDLLDERDRALDTLSEYTSFQLLENPKGSVNVLIDGKTIVFQDQAETMQLRPEQAVLRGRNPVGFPFTLNRGDLVINGVDILGSEPPLTVTNANDAGFLVNLINSRTQQTGVTAALDPSGRLTLGGSSPGSDFIRVQTTGVGLSLTGISGGDYTLTDTTTLQLNNGTFMNRTGGRLQALLDTKTQVIPQTISRVNQLTATLIDRVNDIHSSAYDLNGGTGRPFFIGTSPRDIAVGQTLQADPRLVAVAGGPGFPPGDNSKALALANVRFQAMIGGENLDSYYRSLVTDMGTRIAQAESTQKNLQLVRDQISNQREAVSGVNLDEELTHMLQAQRAFAAAARVMNTMDEMLNRIVNGLGA